MLSAQDRPLSHSVTLFDIKRGGQCVAGRPLSSKFPFCRAKLTSAEAWVLLPVDVRCCKWKAHQKQILFVLGDLVRGQDEG